MSVLFHLARHRLPIAVVVVSGVLVIAGCGSSSKPSSASKSASSGLFAAALAYSNCMRSHGVPDFPDPDGQGHIGFTDGTQHPDLNPQVPAFQSAERDCGPFPSGVTPAQEHQQFSKALKAAVCIRANGVPNYPDPKLIDGNIALFFSPNINPSSPAFQKAAKKCGYRVPSGLIGAGPPSSTGR